MQVLAATPSTPGHSDWQQYVLSSSPAEDHVFVKFESIGDIEGEASLRNVCLEYDDGTLIESGPFSDDWMVFSEGTSWMSQYGYIRGEHADVYGDCEGIWRALSTPSVAGRIRLSVEVKFGGGNTNPKRSYRLSLGRGSGTDTHASFKVLAEKVTWLHLLCLPCLKLPHPP